MVDMSSVEICYTDSNKAIGYCKKLGMPALTQIRTSSPAVLADQEGAAVQTDSMFSSKAVLSFYSDYTEWVTRIYQELNSEQKYSTLASVISQRLSGLQTFLYRSMSVNEADLAKAAAVVEIQVADDWQHNVFNSPIVSLLEGRSNVIKVQLPLDSIFSPKKIKQPPPPFLVRIFFLDWTSYWYRSFIALWRYLPKFISKGEVHIYKECELLKEVALSLAKNGFSITTLREPESLKQQREVDLSFVPVLEENIRSFVSVRVAPSLVENVVETFLNEVICEVNEFDKMYYNWSAYFSSRRNNDVNILLTSNLHGASALALGRVMREQGAKIVCCQHGVTREISAHMDREEVFFETVNADLFLTFTKKSKSITDASSITNGRSAVVGMPKAHYCSGKFIPWMRALKPVCFLSTMLYTGNVQQLNRGDTDVGVATFEKKIIRDLLSKIPHQVSFKTYPSIRYPDDDPILEFASSFPNISNFTKMIDFRYLGACTRIIVTSRTSSTLGWCMASGKPVVLVDFPGCPIPNNLHEQFSESIFLFDGSCPDDLAKAVELLSRPIEEIENLWSQKALARHALMSENFDSGTQTAGVSALNEILTTLR